MGRGYKWPDTDLGDCPLFRGAGLCSYGCTGEPICKVAEPEDGWPCIKNGAITIKKMENV